MRRTAATPPATPTKPNSRRAEGASSGLKEATPKPARTRGGDKRERILAAAVKVFAKSGFHGTRVSEVAKAAGVADGTIYLYFRSKDELLVSLFEDRVDKLLVHMNAELSNLPDAPAKLRRVIELQLGLLEGERDLAEVITVIIRQSSKLIKEYAAPKFGAYLDAIAQVVVEGQNAGDFRKDVSPHLVARATYGALDSIALLWALGRAEQGALVRSAKQLADVLLRGLLP